MMKDRTRAFGYVRLSRLEEDSTSPARQRKVIQDLCRQRGWELVDVFEDLDVSGGRESRRGLDAMLARLGDVDAVVTWKLDRLARSLQHLLKLADLFEAEGVQLVTADGAVDTTTAAGRAFYSMRGTFAQFERDLVSERTRAAHAYLKSQGRVQSRTPFGFRKTEDKRLERDPETWPVLVSMMERVAAGESYRRISADHGLPHTTVRIYTRNRRAIESLEQDRPELAAAMRARLQDESFRPGARSLLAGLASCAACGGGLRQSRRGGQRVYGCRGGGHVYANADWLDSLVVRDVLRLLPKVLPQRRNGQGPSRDDRANLERKLEELQDEYDDGLMSRERYQARRDRILGKLARTGSKPQPRLQSATWDELTHDERRLALREVLERVEVSPVPKGGSRARRHPARVALSFR